MRTIILLLLFWAQSCFAVNAIELKGVFGDEAAVFIVDGKQIVMRVGEQKLGVILIGVEPSSTQVNINGKVQTIFMSREIGANYQEPEVKTVRISSKQGGHFLVTGKIGIYDVDFMVDTGATAITMNASTATRLNIDYEKGERIILSTANGHTSAHSVLLESVGIGEITRRNINAIVTLDDSLPLVLLGNSFLSTIDMRTEDGVLIMEAK